MRALSEYPVLFTLLLLVLAVALWFKYRRPGDADRDAPVPRKKVEANPERRLDAVDTVTGWPPQATRVLSSAELRVMTLLRDALPDHMILAQVSLARFLRVPERYSYNDWMRRVGHVCVDFLVCDLAANVVAAVELRENEAAETEKARRRHTRMDRVLAAAGIKVYVWRDATLPQIAAAREMILGAPAVASALPGGAMRPAVASANGGIEGLDELVEARDPPASTWFDELQPTQPTPLGPPTRH